MENIPIYDFKVKEFLGSMDLSKDILKNFHIPSNLVFYRRDNEEIFLFSEEKWTQFVNQMTIASGLTKVQLTYNIKEGNEFLRWLHYNKTEVYLKKSGKITFLRAPPYFEKLKGKNLIVKLYI